MISIYNKGITEKFCIEYCEGYINNNNGKFIKGMVEWVFKRVKSNLSDSNLKIRKNSSNRINLKALKAKLTKIEIKKILETKSENLLNINNEYNLYNLDFYLKDGANYKKDKILKLIFNYSEFRKYKVTFQNGYLLSENLSIKCCPYCNRNYTTAHETLFYIKNELNKKTEPKYVFPEFDHFYPKEKYPLISISFYNLIPSCNICNSHYKNDKDPFEFNLFHPYTEVNNNHFNFNFIPNSVESLYGAKNDFSLNFQYNEIDSINEKVKKSIDFFGIKDNYEKCHSNLIKEIINKKMTYSNKYLDIIKDMYSISREESYRILFESYYEEDKLHKRPFSKLKKDIFDDINV